MAVVGLFEWDDEKRKQNLLKHGVDFEDIMDAFNDENAFHMPDLRKDYGERRIILVAIGNNLLLSIVYTIREMRTRIISARLANKKERRDYDRRTHNESGIH
jgi:uncharacterized protein